MKTRTIDIKSDCAYIIPIGDLHVGDKAFGKKSRSKLSEYIKFIKEHDNARVFLNGDLVNCATRVSKTSPFEQEMDLTDQINEVIRLLEPIKDKIVGATSGNHEQRIEDFSGLNPTTTILWGLGLRDLDLYCKSTGIIKVRVGKRTKYGSELMKNAYTIVFSHTRGGGGTSGSKLNRVEKMKLSTITNADVYCGNHNHAIIVTSHPSLEFDPYNNTTTERHQTFIACGGYLEWNDSYAETTQLEPTEIGSPIICLDGKGDKKVKVEI